MMLERAQARRSAPTTLAETGLRPGAGGGYLLWVRRFATVEELRLALLEFRRHYNDTWIVERHGYRTPAQVRADQLGASATAA